MITKKIRKIIALILVALLILSFVSCSVETGDESLADLSDDGYPPAIPSEGIGREDEEQNAPTPDNNGLVICVDPGHGFLDGGCGDGYLPDGILEKDVNLAIAKMLRDELLLRGFDVIMTHDGVSFPKSAIDDGNQKFNPNERVSYVNTLDIDYFISIHVNSFVSDSSVDGMRIYFKETSRKTEKISEEVALSLSDAVYGEFPDAKEPVVVDHTDDASFAVIRETVAPAALVEVGFATNASDAANMVNPEWQARVAEALAEGIENYFVENEDGE